MYNMGVIMVMMNNKKSDFKSVLGERVLFSMCVFLFYLLM